MTNYIDVYLIESTLYYMYTQTHYLSMGLV